MDGRDWVALLSERPEFSEKCAWEKLNECYWERLLLKRPEFKEKYKEVCGG